MSTRLSIHYITVFTIWKELCSTGFIFHHIHHCIYKLTLMLIGHLTLLIDDLPLIFFTGWFLSPDEVRIRLLLLNPALRLVDTNSELLWLHWMWHDSGASQQPNTPLYCEITVLFRLFIMSFMTAQNILRIAYPFICVQL